MTTELVLRSGLPWLQHQRQRSQSLPLQPLLLLSGDGDSDEGVEVEAALLLACSPLLRRTLSSTSCCTCSAITVVLPSTTSLALGHLAQMLRKGSVTIASDALTDLGALLALLEVDIGRTTGVKRKAAHESESGASALPETSPKMHSPPTQLRSSTPVNTPPPELRTPTPVKTPHQEFQSSAPVKTEPIASHPSTPFTLPSSPFSLSKEVSHCQQETTGHFEGSLEKSSSLALPQMSSTLPEASQKACSPSLKFKYSAPVKSEPVDNVFSTTSSRKASPYQETTEGSLLTLPLVISISLQRLAPKTVEKIKCVSQEKATALPGSASKSLQTICFFCGVALPLGSDGQDMQQRHQEVNLSLEFMIQLVFQLQRLRWFDAS